MRAQIGIWRASMLRAAACTLLAGLLTLQAHAMAPWPGVTYGFGTSFSPHYADWWSTPSGRWEASNGTYHSLDVGHTDVTLLEYYDLLYLAPPYSEVPEGQKYTFASRLMIEYHSRGNLAGLIYDHQDEYNYYEVVFSPTGIASLRKVVNGVMTVVTTTLYAGGGHNAWMEATVTRDGEGLTTVSVDGLEVFVDIPQAEFNGGKLGLVTHWSRAQFDDVDVQVPNGPQPQEHDFNDGVAEDWEIDSGNWNVNSGLYRTTSVQQTAISLAPNSVYSSMYFADYTLTARMMNPYGGRGNLVGFVFDYEGPQDYKEVVFSPTGVASIRRVESGAISTIATASYTAGPRQWFNVELRAGMFSATVLVNDAVVFEGVLTDPQHNFLFGARMGLITHWSPGQFDDFAYHREDSY